MIIQKYYKFSTIFNACNLETSLVYQSHIQSIKELLVQVLLDLKEMKRSYSKLSIKFIDKN